MSPNAVMKKASEMDLDLIAITDHNSIANCQAYHQVALKHGIDLLYGLGNPNY